MSIAKNIRLYRERAGMYQSALGEYLGVSAQAVSKWELGKAEPDTKCIEKMCKLFGITADKLMDIESPVVSADPWNPDDMNYSERENETIRILARGVSRMSQENRERLLKFARDFFTEDFDDEGNRK